MRAATRRWVWVGSVRSEKPAGLRCGQTIVLTGVATAKRYPQYLRRVNYRDKETQKTFSFPTNHFGSPVLTITELYRFRWQVELFFKWVNQPLRIKSFLGTSENAVKSQIRIAVYLLAAIVKKRLNVEYNLHTILQVLSLTFFEKVRLLQILTDSNILDETHDASNQLNLSD